MSLQMESYEVGPLGVNCYFLIDDESKKALIVDPGGNAKELAHFVGEKGLIIEAVVLTHGHGDHIGGVEELREKLHVPLWVHKAEELLLQDARQNLSAFIGNPITVKTAERYLPDGEKISCGSLQFEVLHTPGHSPGGICIYGEGIVLTGDTLFAGSVGRTDFPNSSQETLMRSIHDKLLPLPEGTKVYPGHGPASTIGDEKLMNPYL